MTAEIVPPRLLVREVSRDQEDRGWDVAQHRQTQSRALGQQTTWQRRVIVK